MLLICKKTREITCMILAILPIYEGPFHVHVCVFCTYKMRSEKSRSNIEIPAHVCFNSRFYLHAYKYGIQSYFSLAVIKPFTYNNCAAALTINHNIQTKTNIPLRPVIQIYLPRISLLGKPWICHIPYILCWNLGNVFVLSWMKITSNTRMPYEQNVYM